MTILHGILDNSNKGLMIGNSSLGAIVFGDKFLSISLDKIDLWDERKPSEYKSPLFTYANLEKFFKEDYEKAYEIFDQCYLHPYPSKINAGLIKTNIEVSSDDTGCINTKTAEVSYWTKKDYLKAYVDANEDVIVIENNRPIKYEINLPSYFYKKVREGGLNYRKAETIKDRDFLIVKQPMYDKKSFYIVCYAKDNFLLVTVNKGNDVKKSYELLTNYFLHRLENYEKHLKAVKRFNGKSKVKTPSFWLNEMYDLGKYYFYCNSSKKIPVTTQGVWTQYNDELPPWKGDLHNDLNVQLSYEPFFKTGNYKEAKVLLNFLKKNKRRLEANARKFLGSEGIYIPGVMSQKCEPLGGWPQYALSLCCQIWLLNSFSFYYEYTRDKQYLKNTIYPFFQGVELGIKNYLKEDEEGKLSLSWHSSPEFYENEKKSLLKYQSNFEITCLTFLYTKLCAYAKLLDEDDSYYKKQLNKIRPLYRNSNNELLVSKDVEFHMSHRHFSHMLTYKNIPIYDIYTNKDNLRADLNKLFSQGTDAWTGFAYTEYADFLTLVNEGEKAYEALKIFVHNFVHNNGFHMNNDYKWHKYSKMDCYVFTLEANFSLVNAVNDMMLQNYENKVTIFPSLPSSFIGKGVYFRKLRIHGDHQVSAKRNKNALSFTIKMKNKDTIYLENNFADNPTLDIDGTKQSFASKIGDFIEIEASKYIKFSTN